MQLAARDCDYPVLLFRPLAAQHEASPAPLRLALRARNPLQLQVDIVKRRGPTLGHPLLLDAPAPGLTSLLAWRGRPQPEAEPVAPITLARTGPHPSHVLDRAASRSGAASLIQPGLPAAA